MKTTPILYSAPMARAWFAGRKTMTRRIIARLPCQCGTFDPEEMSAITDEGHQAIGHSGRWWCRCCTSDQDAVSCPYGKPGDFLVGREEYYQFGHWEEVPGVLTKMGRQKWKFVPDSKEILFERPSDLVRLGKHPKWPEVPTWHKRLARFMPNAASRIRQEIEEVRAERLQDISEEDIQKEGLTTEACSDLDTAYLSLFRTLWESIHGPGSWDLNPWLWVLRLKPFAP